MCPHSIVAKLFNTILKSQVCTDVLRHLPILSERGCWLICTSTRTRLGHETSALCFVGLVIFFLEDGNAYIGTISSGIVDLGSWSVA